MILNFVLESLILDFPFNVADLFYCILFKIMGLCGNFNGDTEDDMTTSEGDVSHDTVQFVSSWKTNAACTSNAITDSLGACAQSTDYMTYARNLCIKLRDGAETLNYLCALSEMLPQISRTNCKIDSESDGCRSLPQM